MAIPGFRPRYPAAAKASGPFDATAGADAAPDAAPDADAGADAGTPVADEPAADEPDVPEEHAAAPAASSTTETPMPTVRIDPRFIFMP
ncbi:hypothetical protein ACFRAR_06095 [Kitasatospora sp. NPDC056651]|uniref:hypothetical protein n=1 Tax=Kitasatospora sp. NPDC056651 TaxID=3345892 RepID=UPI0036A0B78F